MGAILEFSKLAELRARTDRDLARILGMELDRGLALANVAANQQSVFRVQAQLVYKRAKTLLPRLAGWDAAEIATLESKLKELGMALDLIAGTMDLEEEPACS